MHPKHSFSWALLLIVMMNAIIVGSCQTHESALLNESILRTQAVETIMAQIVGTAVYETVVAGINNNLPASTPQPPNIANPTNNTNPNNGTNPENLISPTNDIHSTINTNPTNNPSPPAGIANSGTINPGTFLVGAEIKPGIYRGEEGNCTFERLKDLSGSDEAILSNGNSFGPFYIEILDSDYALKTGCNLTLLNSLPEPLADFPQQVNPGMYLVGREILPGNYQGQSTGNSCYWERLSDVTGDIEGVITNGGAVGQFYVRVLESDFALMTGCVLERVGD
jgi:hypothetical protein